jgi:transposase
MPFIDPEQLYEVYLRPAELQTLHRLNQQRWRLEQGITARKNRIGTIIDGYFPGLRQAFDDRWSPRARAFYRSKLNPLAVVRAGEEALHAFLKGSAPGNKASLVETHQVYMACESAAAIYEASMGAGAINEDSFVDLQAEVACELRLMEAEEDEAEKLAQRIKKLYQKLHPEDHLQTIPGVGEHTAPVFLAGVGEPGRFRNQSAFANWNGVVPGAKQSAEFEGKGLRMTKAGPAIMKWGLYQAGDVGRQWDPQLAWVYYRQMVYHGKTHNQAMGAVMSHLTARILAVLREDRPYELRDIEGNPISKKEARQLILSEYQVPEEIRRQRRRRNRAKTSASAIGTKKRGMVERHKMREAASAPQLEAAPAVPHNPVYLSELAISSRAASLVANRVKTGERSPHEAKRTRQQLTSLPDGPGT